MISRLADIFPLLTAVIAINPAKVFLCRVGVRTTMRSSSCGVKRTVVDDHCIDAACFPLAHASTVLPLFAASIAIHMSPIGRVRCIYGANVQAAIEHGECVRGIRLAARTSAIGPRTLCVLIQTKEQ